MSSTSDKTLSESISALVDGESNQFELRRLLKASEQNAEIRETWRRYHMVGHIMRGEAAALSNIDLAATVREAIIHEGVVHKGIVHEGITHENAVDENSKQSLYTLESPRIEFGAGSCVTFSYNIL